VTQQILPILEADSCCAKTMAKRVSQIVHPYFGQTGPVSRLFPGVIPDASQFLATVREDNPGMLTPLSFNDFSGNPIENHNSFLSIFRNVVGNHED
jgi:hypothetical protein